ncbi:hypothetical protein PR048_017474 [Dryococelus australis]|uniref:Integrase catalytic domain-containing protein n=1 Tax=Dryococelus australis TaxID=614101 RepID=A0ABQ9H9W1_9NEOP|nr:hypothetical protein PR048_017474 [Dryococelus australis]
MKGHRICIYLSSPPFDSLQKVSGCATVKPTGGFSQSCWNTGLHLGAAERNYTEGKQVDLIDMQREPDRDYKFTLNYQDHLTKFVVLRPLKTKTADEVADVILDIFCLLGTPNILRSDNGREFRDRSFGTKWNGIKVVHGKPRHSQSQGSIERANQDVRDSFVAWMKDNYTSSWVSDTRIVQSSKNCSYHSGTKRTPYEALFGVPQNNGLLDSCLPSDIVGNIYTEEQLEEYLSNLTQNFDETDIENVDKANTCEINNQQISSPMETEESTSRKHCKRGLQGQAEKMIQTSGKKFPPASTGDNILVSWNPDVDHGRPTPRNVLAVIMEKVEPNLFSIGTKHGKFEKLYSRNEFQLAPNKSLEISDVPDGNVTVRQEAMLAPGSKQSFLRCGCSKGSAIGLSHCSAPCLRHGLSPLLEVSTGLATTQECSGETGWRLGPPRRITRFGKDSRWRPKTLYILPQPSGRQSLTEAAWPSVRERSKEWTTAGDCGTTTGEVFVA